MVLEQFLPGSTLIGAGFHVRVLANPQFPAYAVKEYDCESCNLQHLFDAEVATLKRIQEKLGTEPLSWVVLPQLLGTETRGKCLYEIFPRVYPPEGEDKMIGIQFFKRDRFERAGRGWICNPPDLVPFFQEKVPLVLKELGKAFALLHLKASLRTHDIEIVVGRSSTTGPLRVFLLDFDRTQIHDDLPEEVRAQYFSSFFTFRGHDVFRDFAEVDGEYKTPFLEGYREKAKELGLGRDAEAVLKSLE